MFSQYVSICQSMYSYNNGQSNGQSNVICSANSHIINGSGYESRPCYSVVHKSISSMVRIIVFVNAGLSCRTSHSTVQVNIIGGSLRQQRRDISLLKIWK